MFYVYGLIDGSTQHCFYVGKGCKNRLYTHVKKIQRGVSTQNPHLDHKIAKLIRENINIIHVKFYEGLTEDDAFTKEDEKIRELGIDTLCNVWYGGKGGRIPSEEIRQKISENRRGIPVSEAAKEKMSLAKIGTTQSDETKQKKSVALKGKPQSEKQKLANESRSRSHKGRKFTEEHKQKLREAKKKHDR